MNPVIENYLDRLQILHQDLEKTFRGLPQEALDWVPGTDIPSISILITHLTGAERYWIGDIAMGEPSGRNRESEFHVQGLNEEFLNNRLADTLSYASTALQKLDLPFLQETRVLPDGSVMTVGGCLFHALGHTGNHLGHLQIIRQLWDQQTARRG